MGGATCNKFSIYNRDLNNRYTCILKINNSRTINARASDNQFKCTYIQGHSMALW